MKKSLISFVLILTIIAAFSCSAFAYSPVTRVDGQIWETEPNDYPEDATIIYQQGSTVYPTYGSIRYVYDGDYYLYQCNTTKTRTLRVGRSAGLVKVPDAGLYVGCYDLTTGESICEEHVLVSKGATVTFQSVAGHEYIIYVALEGPVDAIQEDLDITGGQGFRYLVSLP